MDFSWSPSDTRCRSMLGAGAPSPLYYPDHKAVKVLQAPLQTWNFTHLIPELCSNRLQAVKLGLRRGKLHTV